MDHKHPTEKAQCSSDLTDEPSLQITMALAAEEATVIGEKGRQILDSEGYKRRGEARFGREESPRSGLGDVLRVLRVCSLSLCATVPGEWCEKLGSEGHFVCCVLGRVL